MSLANLTISKMTDFQPAPAAHLTNENEKWIEKKTPNVKTFITSNVINTRHLILIPFDVIS